MNDEIISGSPYKACCLFKLLPTAACLGNLTKAPWNPVWSQPYPLPIPQDRKVESGSSWGKVCFCDRNRHQTFPLPEESGDVTGFGRCSERDRLFFPGLFMSLSINISCLQMTEKRELHRPVLVRAPWKGRGAPSKNSLFPCKERTYFHACPTCTWSFACTERKERQHHWPPTHVRKVDVPYSKKIWFLEIQIYESKIKSEIR